MPIVGRDAIICDPVELATYECDGLTNFRVGQPWQCSQGRAMTSRQSLPTCACLELPFVARGAGTGLSGGAVPDSEGVLLVTSRMRVVLSVQAHNQRAVVEPGVTNLEVGKAAQPYGLFYAPDPSSQQVCSIGGNVAENSGGAHCLKYGFTTNHVTGPTSSPRTERR